MDVPSNEIVVRGLSMPHTPRIINGQLFALNSAAQELVAVDEASSRFEVVCRLPGFHTGMVQLGGYLLIGISVPRQFPGFQGVVDGYEDDCAAVVAVNTLSGRMVGQPMRLPGITNVYDLVLFGNETIPQ